MSARSVGAGSLLLARLVLFCLPAANVMAVDAVGVARDVSGGEVLYREQHQVGPDSRHIEYRDAQGRLIATNSLDYSYSTTSPAYTQKDLRNDLTQGARWEGGALVLFSGGQAAQVGFTAPLVISSGFDGFVRENWAALVSGQRRVFDFALPDRLTTVRMRIEREAAPSGEHGGRYTFVTQPDNFLVRWLGAPIELVYDDERRLLRYRGVSNLLNSQGQGQRVVIDYSYAARVAAASPQTAEQDSTDAGREPASSQGGPDR
ncbi:MAG TPA: hypothetical protein VL027_08950 [Spongiibacteraceae bacterium]|nr:hypothetical protein [Spongiibacteraceae bacterium]HUH38059.1 hypothetical protein [Spongiibacteraceae bacterium]